MSKARQKGTKYETYLLDNYLKKVWPNAERAAQKGIFDAGDFTRVGGWVIEAKNRKQWRLKDWIRQVYTKLKNNDYPKETPWVIAFKEDKRSDLGDDYVLAPGWLFWELVHIAKEQKEWLY